MSSLNPPSALFSISSTSSPLTHAQRFDSLIQPFPFFLDPRLGSVSSLCLAVSCLVSLSLCPGDERERPVCRRGCPLVTFCSPQDSYVLATWDGLLLLRILYQNHPIFLSGGISPKNPKFFVSGLRGQSHRFPKTKSSLGIFRTVTFRIALTSLSLAHAADANTERFQ